MQAINENCIDLAFLPEYIVIGHHNSGKEAYKNQG